MLSFLLFFATFSVYLASIAPFERTDDQNLHLYTEFKDSAPFKATPKIKFEETKTFISIDRPAVKICSKHQKKLLFDRPLSVILNDELHGKNVDSAIKNPIFVRKIQTKHVKSKTFAENREAASDSKWCNIS